jgi:carboxymethylenebutenolidase
LFDLPIGDCSQAGANMAEEIRELIREYQDGKITRREFIFKTVALTGSLAASQALIDALAHSHARAAEVDPNDPALLCHDVEYAGRATPVYGYLARPTTTRKFPAIIIIHANQGLNDYTRDVARRLAKEGYVSLAVDFLSRHGGTKKVNPEGEGLGNIRDLAPWYGVAEDADSGFAFLRSFPDVRGDRLGLVGFCWGGEMTFASATQIRGLKATVVFYGRSPKPLDLVKNIQAPVLAHYGEKDPTVNQDIPATEEAMKKYKKSYSYKIYPGAQHGFHTDTNTERYHPEAAKEAWARTLEFFKTNLQAKAGA